MENQEIINEEVNKSQKLLITSIIAVAILVIGMTWAGYSEGVRDTERRLSEPMLHISLIPSEGMVQVIPTKLTDKGIGIKFNSPVTNLSGLGITYADRK